VSYRTIEVKIDHGQIVAQKSENLPETGIGLLTILSSETMEKESDRPIGLAKGRFVVPDNFNDPLPEDVLRDFEGK
jgi:hypothetical protein